MKVDGNLAPEHSTWKWWKKPMEDYTYKGFLKPQIFLLLLCPPGVYKHSHGLDWYIHCAFECDWHL